MAKKNAAPQVPPSVPPDRAIELLRRQQERAEELLENRPLPEDEHRAWKMTTRDFLVKAFGSESPNVSSVMDIGKYGAFPMNASDEWWENNRAEDLQSQITALGSVIEILETEIELEPGSTSKSTAPTAFSNDRAFVVHGHNEGALQAVARYFEQLDVPPVILREQPNSGRTIIEKFVEYSDVGFAVVLLTGDDRGGTADAPYSSQSPRARQNVILELGFFLGKLGRSRVCALFEDGIEVPSDYSGVAFVKLDPNGAWKLELARELKAAGFDIDLNMAI